MKIKNANRSILKRLKIVYPNEEFIKSKLSSI